MLKLFSKLNETNLNIEIIAEQFGFSHEFL